LFKQRQQDYRNYEGLVFKAQAASKKGDLNIALGFLQDARKLRPNSVELAVYFGNLDRLTRERALEEARRKEFQRQQALALEQKLRQEALAREAERQRILAAQQFAGLQEAQRIQLEKQRLADHLAAHQRLVLQADTAFSGGNIPLSVQIYESAAHPRQT